MEIAKSFPSLRLAILGGTRGLGLAIAEEILARNSGSALLICGRKIESISSTFGERNQIQTFKTDLSEPEELSALMDSLKKFAPTHLVYSAAGGPYGAFGERPFHSHLWSWQVTFLTPAALIHGSLKGEFPSLKQIVVIGSAIAEAQGDAFAASYASAKHAAKGLLESLWAESSAHALDLRLFSPGYMDTALLPPKAKIRETPEKILSPTLVAKEFVQWMVDPRGEKHYIITNL